MNVSCLFQWLWDRINIDFTVCIYFYYITSSNLVSVRISTNIKLELARRVAQTLIFYILLIKIYICLTTGFMKKLNVEI
jgi:hypothetical protein